MRIPEALIAEVVAHAERDRPDECCGVLATRDGVVVAAHPLENTAASPMRFDVHGPTLARLLDDLEDDGQQLGAIYHSHTRSEAYPSQTDVNFAAGWPGVEWLIVGTRSRPPEVRSFLIDGGTIDEVPVERLRA